MLRDPPFDLTSEGSSGGSLSPNRKRFERPSSSFGKFSFMPFDKQLIIIGFAIDNKNNNRNSESHYRSRDDSLFYWGAVLLLLSQICAVPSNL